MGLSKVWQEHVAHEIPVLTLTIISHLGKLRFDRTLRWKKKFKFFCAVQKCWRQITPALLAPRVHQQDRTLLRWPPSLKNNSNSGKEKFLYKLQRYLYSNSPFSEIQGIMIVTSAVGHMTHKAFRWIGMLYEEKGKVDTLGFTLIASYSHSLGGTLSGWVDLYCTSREK